MPARIAIMAMTTRSSMSVNPDRDWGIRVLLVMESMKDAEKGPIHFFGDTVSKCSGMARTEWGLLLIENGKWKMDNRGKAFGAAEM
jgi:hypothetical protein